MKDFMDRDFLLETDTAKTLYHDYAEDMPIIDYHCHISPKDIAEDIRFENVTQALLGGGNFGDHYVWRLMRACGYPEDEVTGEAGDRVRHQRFGPGVVASLSGEGRARRMTIRFDSGEEKTFTVDLAPVIKI